MTQSGQSLHTGEPPVFAVSSVSCCEEFCPCESSNEQKKERENYQQFDRIIIPDRNERVFQNYEPMLAFSCTLKTWNQTESLEILL